MSDLQYLQKEYAYAFLDPDTGGYDEQNDYYDLLIANNLPAGKECEFCQQVHKDSCLLDFHDNEAITISQILGKIQHTRELELTIQWKPQA